MFYMEEKEGGGCHELFSGRLVRHTHGNFVVEATCTTQGRVQGVRAVGSANDQDRLVVCLVPREV